MTTLLEDRLRRYGATLDHAATAHRTAAHAASDADSGADMLPLLSSSRQARRPRRLLPIAAAAAASMLLLAGGAWAIRSRHDFPSPTQPGAAPSADQPLLFPPGTTPTGTVIFVPEGRYSTVVTSPSGAPYTIDVMENFFGSLPAGTPTRNLNGTTFGVVSDPTALDAGTYEALDQCSLSFTKGKPDNDPWNPEALALLGAQAMDNGVVTVNLPAGWTLAVPSGALVTPYEYTVAHGVAGGQTTIISAPSATAAMIFGLYGRPGQINRADFDGHRAWFSTYPGSNTPGNNHLSWEAAGNAYDITARGATQAQLIAYARTLVPGSVADFEAHNPDLKGSAGTVGSTVPGPAGGCPTRELKVQGAAGS
jgi:hypothetical protein